MRKNRPFLFLISMLLLLVTVFSFSSAALPHKDACSHSVCEYCEELEQAEQHLQETIRTHGDCNEAGYCEVCALIRMEQTYLHGKRSGTHACHAEICFSCLLNVLSRRIRSFAAALTVLLLAVAAIAQIRYLSSKSSVLLRKVTLIDLKVKLTD